VYEQIQPDVILHLAAQVAVTLSISNPLRDFYSNAQGTFNLLELARQSKVKPIFIYASTNKVYGDLQQQVTLKDGRYTLANKFGYDEATPLSFHTPYGCSKGGADQYVLDYHRTYGLPVVVLRQSCIYGPYQYGFEDQGWVAWFAIGAILDKPLTIYGDGCQVRDVLYVGDLIDLYARCMMRIDAVAGHVFNVGGGPGYTLAVNELVSLLQKKTGKFLPINYSQWRLGDQKVFICDIRKAKQMLDWQPQVAPQEGLGLLMDWITLHQATIARLHESNQYIGKRLDLTIVIPARNEEDCLANVLNEVKSFLNTSIYKTEVIVVNDRSSDNTKGIASQYAFVRLIDNPYPSGKGYALRAGFEEAKGEYIAMMDADFSHDVMDLSY
jgi:CDP-paratose 2-epimerase